MPAPTPTNCPGWVRLFVRSKVLRVTFWLFQNVNNGDRFCVN